MFGLILGVMVAHLGVVFAFLGPRRVVQADVGPKILPKWCPKGLKIVRFEPPGGLAKRMSILNTNFMHRFY